ncbi:hypothetical protein O3M35_000778 [Rhynocoris fuscipes]|uniref:SF3 helicase domain-containing protein n=1 Tax=Rhynocoris fuscipes TaxID=488301 RepID=A0AAW1DQP2_9HEMI
MTYGSQEELTLLQQCVSTSLKLCLHSSDQMDSSSASPISRDHHTSTSFTTVPTATEAVDVQPSTSYTANLKVDDNITDESSDEEEPNTLSNISKVSNIIQHWKGATGWQHRSQATSGLILVQLRIMPYQACKKMDRTQRYKTTKKYAEIVLNPLNHTPQIRALRQLFKDFENITLKGTDLEKNLPLSGPPSVGKTWFANIIGKLMMNTGYIANSNRYSSFPFQDCPRRNLLIFDEPNVEPIALENFKLLFAGTPTPANVKYESQNLINRTPVIVTCNRDPFPKTPEFQTRIKRFHWNYRIDNFIQTIQGEIHPLGLYNLLINRQEASIAPSSNTIFDNTYEESIFGSEYSEIYAQLEEDNTYTPNMEEQEYINEFNTDLL